MNIRLVLSTTALALGLTVTQAFAQIAYGTTLGDDKYQPSVGQSGQDVIWVPTNDAVADAMLKAANVGPNDLVFDLGAGDGKIAIAAARIKKGLQKQLVLGNLDAKRDWGFAGDYVEAMWLMLQQPQADDYVIASGETHSVREFLEEAFGIVGLDWKKYVEIDQKYFRPAEVDLLIGDSSKAKKILGWEPKVRFKDLVKMMVEADIKNINSKN